MTVTKQNGPIEGLDYLTNLMITILVRRSFTLQNILQYMLVCVITGGKAVPHSCFIQKQNLLKVHDDQKKDTNMLFCHCLVITTQYSMGEGDI